MQEGSSTERVGEASRVAWRTRGDPERRASVVAVEGDASGTVTEGHHQFDRELARHRRILWIGHPDQRREHAEEREEYLHKELTCG